MLKRLFLLFFICILAINAQADEWVFPVGNPDVGPALSGNGNVADGFGGWEYTQHFLDNEGTHYGSDMDYSIDESQATDSHKMVRAIARGRIVDVYSGDGYNFGWGKCIIIRHDVMRASRYVFSLYGHLDSISKAGVEDGRIVYAGQQLGIVGNTGNSTNTHLHLSVFTRDNGDNSWHDITCRNILGYDNNATVPANHNSRHLHTDTSYSRNVTFYDPITFIKFGRLGSISPPAIKSVSINNDLNSSEPSQLTVGKNTIEVQVATYMKEMTAYLSIRDYAGGSVGGEMSLVNTKTSGWIMSSEYDPLGRDITDGGWNSEYSTTYRYEFNLSSSDDAVDIALFWKPKNYESSTLIMPIPSGVAHNTVVNNGRYIRRSVE